MKTKSILVLFAVCCTASALLAQPSKPFSPLDRMAIARGWVDIRTLAGTVTVHVGGPDGALERVFKVEVADSTALPVSLRADFAQVFYWRGHLAVLASGEGKALHFSIPGFETPHAPATGRLVPGADLDALQSRYDLTKIETATAIVAGEGPRVVLDPLWGEPRSRSKLDDLTPPPSGGGVGTCGVSCNITCGDGSSCSVSCAGRRCAACTCPASCSCS
jgi:hypothetical protein